MGCVFGEGFNRMHLPTERRKFDAERSKQARPAQNSSHPDLNAGQVHRGVYNVADPAADVRQVEVAPAFHSKCVGRVGRVWPIPVQFVFFRFDFGFSVNRGRFTPAKPRGRLCASRTEFTYCPRGTHCKNQFVHRCSSNYCPLASI